MSAPGLPEIDVAGGAGGTEARLQDLGVLADGSADLAGRLGGIALDCHQVLVDPDVLASAALDPAGFADFESRLLGALDGSGGLTALAVRLGARALAVRAAQVGYEAADTASAALMDSLEYVGGITRLTYLAEAAMFLGAGIEESLSADGESFDPQRFLTDHPGMVDWAIGSAPGLLTHGMFDLQQIAGALGNLGYPDGHGTATDLGTDSALASRVPPQTVNDLLTGLDRRNTAAGDQESDQIDVRAVTQADGSTAYVVDIPGTHVGNLPFTGFTPETNDMGTNVRVLAGQSTAREEALAAALRDAEVPPDAPVMLVGHSQGGMLAAQAAADSGTADFDFNVTHVVTAGSPIALADVPDDVQVLALENENDLVPRLDSEANPESANMTTVTFSTQNGTIGANHSIADAYVPAAEAVDASDDPSLVAFRDSAGAFLGGTSVQTQLFDLNRVPG